MEHVAELAEWYNRRKEHLAPPIRAEDVPIKVDDSGVGGGVVDILRGRGYNVVPVNSSEVPNDPEHYPNRRSELWFVTAARARRGDLDLSRLDPHTRDELRRQALTATWSLDAEARRKVMDKDKIKAELGRSPDGIDAVNLAYYAVGDSGAAIAPTYTRANPLGTVFTGGR
jgi:hypothetical protein